MKAYFWRSHTKTIPAALTLTAALLLTGCLGNDEEDWNGKNISGLMPELEFDLINSQGDAVSGSDYMFARLPCKSSIRQPVAWTRSFRMRCSLCS